MSTIQYFDADFGRIRPAIDSRRTAFHLYYGDAVIVADAGPGWQKITAVDRANTKREVISGFFKGSLPVRDTAIFKMSMVDVQQGDGMVIETPSGKIILVDGGDNKLFARHVAARFRARPTSADDPLEIDALIITHGDADHYSGLNELRKSETLTGSREHKRIFIHPKRVFHNGLVKGPSRLSQKNQLGKTVIDTRGFTYITDLYDDIREAAEEATNRPFDSWRKTLNHWAQRGPIAMHRVDLATHTDDVFDFLAEDNITLELHSPLSEEVHLADGSTLRGLRFLPHPPKTATLHEQEAGDGHGSLSASHTINGHSIAFRLQFGQVRMLFTGDLNKEAMDVLESRLTARQLEAEILKTPHHGSADFDLSFLKKVRPVLALISSGDESARKEYIHPRATLMNALGAASRHDTGLLLSTELTAFFAYRGESYLRSTLRKFFADHPQDTFSRDELEDLFAGQAEGTGAGEPRYFHASEKTQFGLIEIRTDGERVLIFTHSGKNNVFEAYRFRVTRARNGRHMVRFADAVEKVG